MNIQQNIMPLLSRPGALIDVGANFGQSSIKLLAVEGARVIAFEPVVQTYIGMCSLLTQANGGSLPDNITVYNLAVGEKVGVASISIPYFEGIRWEGRASISKDFDELALEANESYEVEHSSDGIHFTILQTITTLGSSSYYVTDNNPSSGYNYYRVKSLSIDGEEDYTKVESVAPLNAIGTVSVYPNPAKGSVNIMFTDKPAGTYTIHLYNYLGQAVSTANISIAAGSTSYQLPFQQIISSGNYQLEIIGNDGVRFTDKILVE
jgi:FkbM family methyltransferase